IDPFRVIEREELGAAVALAELDAAKRCDDLLQCRIRRRLGREIGRDRSFATRQEQARRHCNVSLAEAWTSITRAECIRAVAVRERAQPSIFASHVTSTTSCNERCESTPAADTRCMRTL